MRKRKLITILLVVTLLVTMLLMVGCAGNGDTGIDPETEGIETEGSGEQTGIKPGEAEGPEIEAEEPPQETGEKETVSQKNAIRKANDYLKTMAFSKKGLMEQLEFEGFSTEDAVYAVEKIDVNWQEQAVKKAKDYLDTMAFSRSGLIEQLEFEGFSNEDAVYAADQMGF